MKGQGPECTYLRKGFQTGSFPYPLELFERPSPLTQTILE